MILENRTFKNKEDLLQEVRKSDYASLSDGVGPFAIMPITTVTEGIRVGSAENSSSLDEMFDNYRGGISFVCVEVDSAKVNVFFQAKLLNWSVTFPKSGDGYLDLYDTFDEVVPCSEEDLLKSFIQLAEAMSKKAA